MEKERNIGALWVKQGAKGEYLSGNIEIDGVKHNIICFVNGFKEEPKHPDYQIYKSRPKQQENIDQEAQNEAQLNAEMEALAAEQEFEQF